MTDFLHRLRVVVALCIVAPALCALRLATWIGGGHFSCQVETDE